MLRRWFILGWVIGGLLVVRPAFCAKATGGLFPELDALNSSTTKPSDPKKTPQNPSPQNPPETLPAPSNPEPPATPVAVPDQPPVQEQPANPPPPPRPAVVRLAIPDAAAQANASRLVHEIYSREFASTSANVRNQLAHKLLEQAKAPDNDPAARYVLLREASQVAISGANAVDAIEAEQQLEQQFKVDGLTLRLELCQALCSKVAAPDAPALVKFGQQLLRDMLDNDEYERANRLPAFLEVAAIRAKDPSLVRQTAGEIQDAKAALAEYQRLQPIVKKLQDASDTQGIDLAGGQFYCFTRGLWKRGLPLLAKGSDFTMSRIAKAELSNPVSQRAWEQLADAWWEIAASQTNPLHQYRIRKHAAEWYQKAFPQLTGLRRMLVQRRMQVAEQPPRGVIVTGPGTP